MSYFSAQNSDFNDNQAYSNIKIEYHDPTDTGRVVSQTFYNQQNQQESLLKVQKILSHVENNARIAIKREFPYETEEKVIVINGWDRPINYTTEMLNIQTEKCSPFQSLHKTIISSKDIANSSLAGTDSGIESDCTDGNLSWLLNYKIQELPPVPDIGTTENENGESEVVNTVPQMSIDEIVISEGYQSNQQPANNLPKKPPFTYTELIEHALTEQGELTVSGIYNWISNHFPFYKANDDRWKNSVRHNLSINPHFRKGGKAAHGAGHLWTIAQRDESKSWQMRERINDFIKTQKIYQPTDTESDFDKELQAATQSIMEEINNSERTEVPQLNNINSQPIEHVDEDIQVEFINMPEGVTGLEGFLSTPVSKQEIINECGLGSDFFITDINPTQLGLNLTESEANDDRIYEEMLMNMT